MCTVLNSFMQQVENHPESIAIIHGNRLVTYQELDRDSDLLCGLLQKAEVKPGDTIPLIAQRTPEFIIGIIAILKAGASYIPVDIHYPQKRIEQVIEQSGAPVILTSHAALSSIMGASTRGVIAIDSHMGTKPLSVSPVQPEKEDIAYVIFTSGTTGVPKGVMVSHASLHNLVSWHNAHFKMTQESRSTLIAGISFDVAQWEIWSPLTCGATLVLPDDDDIRLQPDMLQRFFINRGITHAFIPTVLVAEFVQQAQPDDLALRYLFTAGEKLGPVNLSHVPYQLVDYYGPTEATIFTTCNLVECATQNSAQSIGLPIAGAEVFILDEQLQPVADGQSGEMYIAGPGLARGYLNAPKLTGKKFLTLPFAPGKRLYRSGDRALRLPDGRIQFLGRLDDQVKIRGNRIELGEIESVLMQVEGVTSALALVTEETPSNEKKILAFVAAQGVDQSTLRAKLAETLPNYFMPAAIQVLPRLPLTPNGKTDKQALLASYRAEATSAPEGKFHGLEVTLAAIWKELLGIDVPTPDDNFFDLGGHSLLAARMATAITEQTNIRAYLRDIFDYPTIRSLAQTLNERRLSIPSGDDKEPLRVLQNDVYLPDDIHFSGQFDERQISHPHTIFLTGATGFVGAHLLADLLRGTQACIHCLVRSKDTEHAQEKIHQTLIRYDITLSPEQCNRIRPVMGDLAEPRFGLEHETYQRLSQETDLIYHSASAVNFIQPYSWMKHINVQGLQEIIRFAASARTKPLMLLSTISVYSWGHLHTGKKVMYEDDDIDQNLPAVSDDIGYVRSKWVMEKIADLAASRGLPLMTFRVGYATCHSETGVSADYQWWGRLVETCLKTGTVPSLWKLYEGLNTVDYMSQAIATISRNPQALGHKFNLVTEPQNTLTLDEFFQKLEAFFGFEFTRMPFTDWVAQWEQDPDAPLYPLLSLFKDNIRDGQCTVQLYQNAYLWDCRNVKHFLQGSGIEEPTFDRDVLARYLKRSIGHDVQAHGRPVRVA